MWFLPAVFIGGARQVGKTSLSLSLLSNGSESHPAYVNWDNPKGRKSLLQGELSAGQPLIILYEINKFGRGRNLFKGLYDTNKSNTSLLITGSARLDYYSRGGEFPAGQIPLLPSSSILAS
jgi:predicted AAA+ superfamily ATPase